MKEFYMVQSQKFAAAANKFAHMANNAVNERQRELAIRYFKDSLELSKEYQKRLQSLRKLTTMSFPSDLRRPEQDVKLLPLMRPLPGCKPRM